MKLSKGNLFNLLELNNFRSYEDLQIGPFKRFNLIYGKNGTGKTSLIEAFEIALSGKSTRIQDNSDIINVISKDKKTDVNILLRKGKRILAKYNSFQNQEFKPKKVLKNLFGIDASGNKAKILLPKLLQIHNVLFSEKIIQFLEANKRQELKASMEEMIAGRDANEQWESIENARNIIDRNRRKKYS